jgi:hypothetical protein
MKAILLVSVGLMSLSARAEIYIQVDGVVGAASVPFGPWADVQVGDKASMVFAVPEQGVVLVPDHAEAYPILTESFAMAIKTNDATVGLRDSVVPPPTVTVSDDYPIADTFIMSSPDAIAMSQPGYALLFELHDSTGTAWSSPTLASIPGTYPAESFDDREWFVFVGAGGIVLEVTDLIVYPVQQDLAANTLDED